jgi:hypothetical protein
MATKQHRMHSNVCVTAHHGVFPITAGLQETASAHDHAWVPALTVDAPIELQQWETSGSRTTTMHASFGHSLSGLCPCQVLLLMHLQSSALRVQLALHSSTSAAPCACQAYRLHDSGFNIQVQDQGVDLPTNEAFPLGRAGASMVKR